MTILSRRRTALAILLYEQSIHLAQITLCFNTQLLSNRQHAYQSFLSHFLVLFVCNIVAYLVILDQNVNMNKNYSYRTTIYKVFCTKCMYFWYYLQF